ncbi:anti-sigma factor family protein [Tenggerimyces flavus]|uniref:Anti-sigma factor family protein n=1 Tax=Tenggerimyces flavus TaxID=1708749 RepID=A0ABV7YJF4_9ACTN|nr:zf-HC2 domain-containing protein [Tenggerimyces flavus]MBM7790036.1 anti-sigma factor RsiW [Tenggerimyces flavus]
MIDLTCQELVELLTDYLDGALDAETKQGVADHCAICGGCGPYLEQLRQTIAVLGRLR